MGTQFWWFFDAVIAAAALVMIFLGAKRGLVKTITTLVAVFISIIIGTAAGGSVSGFFYDSAVRTGNVRHIEEGLSKNNVIEKMKAYIEDLGYNVRVDESKLTAIFKEGGDVREPLYVYLNNINGKTVDDRDSFYQKITEGFAEIMGTIISDNVSDYAGEITVEKIMKRPAEFGNTLKMIASEENEEVDVHKKAAEYIEKQYTAEASKEMVKLLSSVIIVIVVMIIALLLVNKYGGGGTPGAGDLAARVTGGLTGIAVGAAVIYIIVMVTRLLVVLGSNDMMLFNSDTIDKTFVFRHIYNLLY